MLDATSCRVTCLRLLPKNGRPWAALGTPGGHTIAQTVPQLVSNLIDFGMNMQEAIDRPRVSFVESNALFVENEIAQETVRKLRDLGHEVVPSEGGIGFAHGLMLLDSENRESIRFSGGFDDRGGRTGWLILIFVDFVSLLNVV